jgi:hypothetical protein
MHMALQPQRKSAGKPDSRAQGNTGPLEVNSKSSRKRQTGQMTSAVTALQLTITHRYAYANGCSEVSKHGQGIVVSDNRVLMMMMVERVYCSVSGAVS